MERAAYFFHGALQALTRMPTRTLARPVVLLLSFGYSRAWFEQHPDTVAPAPRTSPTEFGAHAAFVPQKVRAIARAKILLAAGAVAGLATGLALLWVLL
jgi:hypothetical protein